MRVSDFSFELPDDLIAHHPKSDRSSCRLLELDGLSGAITHSVFTNILNKLEAGDLLVFNNTRVMPARIFGRKVSGGKVEVLVERVLDDHRALAHVHGSKATKLGTTLILGDDQSVSATVTARRNTFYELCFNDNRNVFTILDTVGHIPLPPYINRPDEKIDRELYQTVYSEKLGAAAAPTAGLHFDQSLLSKLRAKGIEMAFITLHIGSGTFQKIRAQTIEEHVMHAEYTEVSKSVVDAVLNCKARGKRVVAVGTTAARSLESAANIRDSELITPFFGDTRIFITPGYQYQVVDALVTNFHLPESTLIILVAAFAGYKNIMSAYRQAVLKRYLFFSYGDAMLISRNPKAEQEFIHLKT